MGFYFSPRFNADAETAAVVWASLLFSLISAAAAVENGIKFKKKTYKKRWGRYKLQSSFLQKSCKIKYS